MGDIDLLHPPRELEQRRHKLKRLVQTPNSFFMDVKCPGCFNMCAAACLLLYLRDRPPGSRRAALPWLSSPERCCSGGVDGRHSRGARQQAEDEGPV